MAGTPTAADRSAAARYGSLVDQIAAQYRNPYTGRPLSGAALLLKLASGESGFNSNADSGKAHGRTQFTPASRATVLHLTGGKVDPWRSVDEAYHAAALHLLGKVNGQKGLEGYNPGMGSYPGYILDQKIGKAARGLSSGAGGATVSVGGDVTPRSVPEGAVSAAAQALLAGVGQRPQPVASSGLQAPAFAAHPAMPQAYQQPASSGGGGMAQQGGIDALLQAAATAQGGDIAHSPSSGLDVTSSGGGSASGVTKLKGVAQFDGKPVAAWIAPALEYARKHGWKGTVQSGYRSAAEQQKAAAGFGLSKYGPGGPQKSNHRFTGFPGGAVDVTNPQQLAELLKRSPYGRLLVWAGSKDPVHFSHPHGGGY